MLFRLILETSGSNDVILTLITRVSFRQYTSPHFSLAIVPTKQKWDISQDRAIDRRSELTYMNWKKNSSSRAAKTLLETDPDSYFCSENSIYVVRGLQKERKFIRKTTSTAAKKMLGGFNNPDYNNEYRNQSKPSRMYVFLTDNKKAEISSDVSMQYSSEDEEITTLSSSSFYSTKQKSESDSSFSAILRIIDEEDRKAIKDAKELSKSDSGTTWQINNKSNKKQSVRYTKRESGNCSQKCRNHNSTIEDQVNMDEIENLPAERNEMFLKLLSDTLDKTTEW